MERLGVLFATKTVSEEYITSLPTENNRPCHRILMIASRPHVIDQRIDDGKLYIEGELDISFAYVWEEETDGNLAYHCEYARQKKALTFKQVIAVRDVTGNMIPDSTMTVVNIHANPTNSGKAISLQVVIETTAKVYKNEELDLSSDCLAVQTNSSEDKSWSSSLLVSM